MNLVLPSDRMPEAEVALRLAFYLLRLPKSEAAATVNIDGAQVRVHGSEVFPIAAFMAHYGWHQEHQVGKNAWQGSYERDGKTLELAARSGMGDVVSRVGGKRVRAECKQGPLVKKPGSPEYPRFREAIGQVMTVGAIGPADVMVVAVPHTEPHIRLVTRWRKAPLISRSGIQLVTVGRNGEVLGLQL